MKRCFLTVVLVFIANLLFAQSFVTTWKTDNPGTSNDNQITIPTTGTGYNYVIDWGDGSSNSGVTGSITHTYAIPGTYTISISGDFPRIYYGYPGDNEKLLTIEQWGDIAWTSMSAAFYGCTNLTVPATDVPNLSNVTDLGYMFGECSSFNTNINNWDVSNILNMNSMFYKASSYNQPLNNWDVSKVTEMKGTFNEAISFNQSIDSWDVSSVTNMSDMFRKATAFNQPLNGWNVSNVTNMSNMFFFASVFNKPLNNWNVGSVINFSDMFGYAFSFDQPLNDWNISNTKRLDGMFYNATSFNQSLNDWNVSNIISMAGLFGSAHSFNQPLDKWDVSNVQNMNSIFAQCYYFNQPLDNWNVSNVLDMTFMFFEAYSFDQSLNNWNVSNVMDMQYMFQDAISFNQPLDNWDVSNVTKMNNLFWGTSSFNQALDTWDVSNVKNMSNMLSWTNLSISNYDATLQAWAVLPILQNNIMLDVNGLKYCLGENLRQKLIDDYNWTINGDERHCIENQTYEFSINENSSNGTIVGSFEKFSINNEELFYSIETNDNILTVDSETKELIVSNQDNLDYETKPELNYILMVTDGSETINSQLLIHVLNVNEAPEVENYEFAIDEGSEEGTIIGSISALDPENDAITFSILSGNTDNAFTLNEQNKIIVSNSTPIDFEISSYFNLVLEASDGELSSNSNVLINVNKVLGIYNHGKQLAIYPNPAHSRLIISCANALGKETKIQIFNTQGNLIKEEKASTEIYISNLVPGIYFLQLTNEDVVQRVKFYKN